MRVLQVMAGARQGGAETYFVNLVSALQRAGIEQVAAIRRHPERAASLTAAGVRVAEYRFGGALDILTPWRLGALAKRLRPDLAVTWMSRATDMMPRGPWPIVARLGGYYDLKRYAKADWLVANTPDIARWCLDKDGGGWQGAPGRVRCIPNFGVFAPAPAVPRETLDTPEGAPLLLAMGRLHPNKGFDILLRALAEVPEAYLWLAGEGEERAALENLARELGVVPRVRFLGWRRDREALSAACDVYVVPSRHEPFGNVLLDAWGAGKPLVATLSEGPKQFVAEGESGLLVPVDDPRALGAAIREVIALPELAARLGTAGRRQFERDHAEAAVVGEWKNLFEEVVATCAASRG